MGRLHVSNAHYVPGMEVVAYADVDKNRASEFLHDFGGRYATDDIHASADYRRHLAGVYAARSLARAYQRARA